MRDMAILILPLDPHQKLLQFCGIRIKNRPFQTYFVTFFLFDEFPSQNVNPKVFQGVGGMASAIILTILFFCTCMAWPFYVFTSWSDWPLYLLFMFVYKNIKWSRFGPSGTILFFKSTLGDRQALPTNDTCATCCCLQWNHSENNIFKNSWLLVRGLKSESDTCFAAVFLFLTVVPKLSPTVPRVQQNVPKELPRCRQSLQTSTLATLRAPEARKGSFPGAKSSTIAFVIYLFRVNFAKVWYKILRCSVLFWPSGQHRQFQPKDMNFNLNAARIRTKEFQS